MKIIVELAEKIGYDKFHPQWFENNKLDTKTELLELVLLQKWIREEFNIDVIITSQLIGYGYMIYHRYPPKNVTNKLIFQTYEDGLKEGIREVLIYKNKSLE